MHWGDGAFGMGWMWIWWLLGLLVVVAVVRALMRPRGGGPAGGESPEQALKQRFARGEIDREEYERSLEDLRR